jgi:hypothetical protein
LPVTFQVTAAVASQTAECCKVDIVDGRNRMAQRQCSDLSAFAGEHRIDADHEAAGAQLSQALKDGIKIARAARIHDRELEAKHISSGLNLLRLGLCGRTSGIDEQSDDLGIREHLVQQLKFLRPDLGSQRGYSSDVAGWPIEIGYKADRHRINPD